MRERLSVGDTLSRIFDTYWQKAGVLMPAAFLVFLIVDLVAALLYRSSAHLVLGIVSFVIGTIGTFWYQGVVAETVREEATGASQLSIARLFKTVEGRLLALIGVGILAAIGIGIGLILLIVPGLVLLTWWALVIPVIVIERGRPLDAFGRSRELVRGSSWQVFGVILVVFLIQYVVEAILRSVGSGTFIGYWLLALAGHVLTVPLIGITAAVLYFQLKRVAEARAGAQPQNAPGPSEPGSGPSSEPGPATSSF
jgi:hypothetical protein